MLGEAGDLAEDGQHGEAVRTLDSFGIERNHVRQREVLGER
jgi:hypothetical protein